MTIVKSLNLAAYALQLVALFLATRIDLKALAIARAEQDITGNPLLDAYECGKTGKDRTLSAEEITHQRLSSDKDEKLNSKFVRWAAFLVAISILLQGAATWIDPD